MIITNDTENQIQPLTRVPDGAFVIDYLDDGDTRRWFLFEPNGRMSKLMHRNGVMKRSNGQDRYLTDRAVSVWLAMDKAFHPNQDGVDCKGVIDHDCADMKELHEKLEQVLASWQRGF